MNLNYKPLFFLAFFVLFFTQLKAQNTLTTLSELDFGYWAYKQHVEILQNTYNLIENNKITVFQNDKNLAFDPHKKATLFSNEFAVWIQSDPEDPEIGYDSIINYSNFDIKAFSDLSFTKQHVFFKIKNQLVYIKKEDFLKTLTTSNKKYMDYFLEINQLRMDKIPEKSREILHGFHITLRDYSLSENISLYKNDSLQSKYNLKEKTERANQKRNITLYRGSDMQDEYDTVILFDPFDLKNNDFIQMYMLISFNNYQIQIKGISPSVTFLIGDAKTPPISFGFIDYPSSLKALEKHKSLFEELLEFSIATKLRYNDWERKDFLERFNLKEFSLY
ncbi:MAG: hypothetical protein Q8K70_01075 [Bacteroidota bacterium]|nr:hypothetical protein [Bacteroidota bacterium]